jgi:hypothetical protein
MVGSVGGTGSELPVEAGQSPPALDRSALAVLGQQLDESVSGDG